MSSTYAFLTNITLYLLANATCPTLPIATIHIKFSPICVECRRQMHPSPPLYSPLYRRGARLSSYLRSTRRSVCGSLYRRTLSDRNIAEAAEEESRDREPIIRTSEGRLSCRIDCLRSDLEINNVSLAVSGISVHFEVTDSQEMYLKFGHISIPA